MIHSNIQFTHEAAENDQMPFLDVWIDNTERILKLKHTSKTYKALVFTLVGFVPSRYKLNVLKTLLLRAYSIGNSYCSIHGDFEGISSILK